MTLSPGGQNPLIKLVIEEFCSRFAPGATVVYIGDAENKFLHLDAVYLENLGVVIALAAKMPDVVVHDTRRNWLLLIEAVTSAGPVDGKRRKELKELFKGCKAGLVFALRSQTVRRFSVLADRSLGKPRFGLRMRRITSSISMANGFLDLTRTCCRKVDENPRPPKAGCRQQDAEQPLRLARPVHAGVRRVLA